MNYVNKLVKKVLGDIKDWQSCQPIHCSRSRKFMHTILDKCYRKYGSEEYDVKCQFLPENRSGAKIVWKDKSGFIDLMKFHGAKLDERTITDSGSGRTNS